MIKFLILRFTFVERAKNLVTTIVNTIILTMTITVMVKRPGLRIIANPDVHITTTSVKCPEYYSYSVLTANY